MSLYLENFIANKREYGDNGWYPGNTGTFVAGSDPFKFNKTEHNRKSNGAGAVFFKRDL